jgi:hypothetical protein
MRTVREKCGLAATAVRADLVSYWAFDEGEGTIAHDSHGINDGTINGATWTTGRFGNALHFDGVNDYVAGSTSPFNFADTTFTAAAWFKTTSINQVIISEGGGSAGWFLGMSPDGAIRVMLKETSHAYNAYTADTVNTYNDGQWHHVAAVITTSTASASLNHADIYVDQVDGAPPVSISEVKVYSYGSTNQKWRIGARTDPDVPGFFSGSIDEVRIYNHGLTPEEIAAIVPEPATVLTLGLGSLVLLRRKHM